MKNLFLNNSVAGYNFFCLISSIGNLQVCDCFSSNGISILNNVTVTIYIQIRDIVGELTTIRLYISLSVQTDRDKQ